MHLPLRPSAFLIAALSFSAASAQQLPISNQQQLIFPIVSIGPLGEDLHFQTSFHFQNRSNSTVQGELILFGRDGSDSTAWLACAGDVLLPVPQDSLLPATRLVVEIPAHGSLRRTGVVGSQDIALIEGWAVFSWEGEPRVEASLELALLHGNPPACMPLRDIPAEQVVTSVVLPATRASSEFPVAVVINNMRETAISVANASEKVAQISLVFYDASGEVTAEPTVQLEPLERMSRLAFEWSIIGLVFAGGIVEPIRPEDFHGTVVIKSDQPIVVGAIDVVFPVLRFLSVPIPMPLFPPFPL